MSKTIYAADLFCGAGGTSTGLSQACEAAGVTLDLTAVNHWPTAVQTHAANHPKARHLCESLDTIDPRKIAPHSKLDLLLASPECTHHSIARGGKPVSDQSRTTAWHVVRWAEAIRPRCIMVENVREFAGWGPVGVNGRPIRSQAGRTFQAWIEALRSLGYTVGHRLLNAADYGAATSRVRLFVFAVRGRVRLPWPQQTHAREPEPGLFGPLPRWRPAREVIDWTLLGESIFTRKRPLSANTLERIRAGLVKFGGAAAEPFLVQLTHGGRLYPLSAPLPTITTARRGEIALVQPFLVILNGGGCKGGGGARDLNAPCPAVTADGERPGQSPRCHDVDAPLPTVTGTATHGVVSPFLVPYYGTGEADSVEAPLRTLTARDRLGLVTPDRYAIDIRFRMLQPHELAAAMSFPANYRFFGTRSDVVKQIGNAVDVRQSRANVEALLGLGVAL